MQQNNEEWLCGEYRLFRLLGKGGFGDVYLGAHPREKAPVAIKILHEPLTNENIREFVTEAGTQRLLRHDHIVRLLDFGIGAKQLPFLIMEYAPGGSLADRHPPGSRLLLESILSYLKPLSSALHYAHNRGVIHRDIKPANFLIGTNGKVLLSDFGINVVALSTRSRERQGEEQKVVGSWAYAAPEQFAGQAVPASDQYSLAVVVYEWLGGERPFHGNFDQLVVQHFHIKSPPPPLHEKMDIPPAIEQVIMRALAKVPEQRFESVQAFADALVAYSVPGSHSEPQPNHPVTPVHESQPTEPTNMMKAMAAVCEIELKDGRRCGIPPTGRCATCGRAFCSTHQANTLSTTWPHLPVAHVDMCAPCLAKISAKAERDPLPSTIVVPAPPSSSQAPPPPVSTLLRTLTGHAASVYWVTWSPDGRRLASTSGDNTVRLWDAMTGMLISPYTSTKEVSWSPDGRCFAIIRGSMIDLCDTATGKSISTLTGHTEDVWGLSWSPDGRRLATIRGMGPSSMIDLCDSATGKSIFTLTDHSDSVYFVAWSPDGRCLASASGDRTVRLWDALSGQLLATLTGHSGAVAKLAWSPDGNRLASACGRDDNTVRVWDVRHLQPLATLTNQTSGFTSVVWSPDGHHLASAGDTVCLWDASSGKVFAPLAGHTDIVWTVRWSPNGCRLASASRDRTVRLWDAATGNPISTLTDHTDAVCAAVWSPDGRRLASCSYDRTVRVWKIDEE